MAAPVLIVDQPSLQAAIVEYLARDQDTVLAARIPTLTQLFEAKANRLLFTRQMENRVTVQTDPAASEPEYIALPSDFQTMRRFRITVGAQAGGGVPFLEFKSNQQMDEFKIQNAGISGQPRYFTIFGNEIELGPTPDNVYTLEMIYRQYLPSLATNSTNWLLTLAPDLYLYGSLLEAAPYLKNDARLQTWGTLASAAYSDLNGLGLKSQFNAGPLTVRPAGVNIW